jgi:hypothetical protein
MYSYRYWVYYFLILLHFFGNFINIIAIFSTSIWLFFYIITEKKIDLYVIFLLLVPSIIFKDSGEFIDSDLDYLPIVNGISNVFIIGPLAMSTKLSFCIAIFIRSLLNKNNFINIKYLIFLFFVVTALISLFTSYFSSNSSPSGLTVGLRIILTFSVLFLPKIIDTHRFILSLKRIFIFSSVCLFLKLTSEHWYFVTFGFLPLLLRVNKFYFLLITIFIGSIALTILFKITILMIILISFMLYFLINNSSMAQKLFNNKIIIFLMLISPVVITIFVLKIDSISNYDFSTVSGYAKFKLLGDRKPIWDSSLTNILDSSFFLGNPGSSFNVYFDFINETKLWTAGSHNIFLEIGRHLGLISMCYLSYILIYFFYKVAIELKHKSDITLFFMFFSVYFSVGISGQAIIYDGVGTLYLLLFNQFYHYLKSID